MRKTLLAALLLAGCTTTTPPPRTVTAAKPTPTSAPAVVATSQSAPAEDPYLWLEEVTGEKALAWARQQNERSTGELTADPRFEPLRKRLLGIYDSKDKIPFVNKQAKYFYNFWRDDKHVRGIWRRVSSLAEYQKKEPAWETVLDVDALATAENENWVFHGAQCLYPKYQRCLISLSRGGADAAVVREFDTVKKTFVEGGFTLPEAKSSVAWKDLDTIYVGTDFGPGSLTDSGYPRIAKEWKRGTPLADAKTLFEGKAADVASGAARSWDHGHVYDFVYRSITFYETEVFLLEGGKLQRIEVPLSANIGTWNGQLLVTLRDDWTIGDKTWPKGSLLAAPIKDFRAGKRDFVSIFTPAANKSLDATANLKSALIVNELEDVHNKLYIWKRGKGGKWTSQPLATQGIGSFDASAVEDNDSDDYWFTATDFTLPTTLSYAKLGRKPQQLKQSPAFFDASGLVVEQHFATSRDGTRVPYFQVSRQGLKLDGNNPTLLTGYGGFEISLEPYYSASMGAGWLERGGVFAQANIRGGGEYGPSWHQAALKTKRQNAYDDFAAVAEDLIARQVTSPRRLGIEGGSNGGLLMGVMLTQRPELFGAIVCMVPLLDMKRFSILHAGASWMAEYGDPGNPEEWAAISRYSPYQNVKPTVKYPRTLFVTSTRDDRVHPGHARKMMARMAAWSHDVIYYENIEGGHGAAANNEQRAFMWALAFTFLAKQLQI
ncbi:MAG: S9 family peptidase [Deltaproteobacteria bacterium]|nr:S9 family peptidase [Deltaproteobacteria bacterium]